MTIPKIIDILGFPSTNPTEKRRRNWLFKGVVPLTFCSNRTIINTAFIIYDGIEMVIENCFSPVLAL